MTVLEILRNAMGRPEPPPSYLTELEKRDAPEVAVVEVLMSLETDSLTGEALNEVRAYAEAGNPEAQRRLGLAYYRGLGVPRDHSQAFMWFSLAAENGDPLARRSGLLILQGVSVEAAADGRRLLAQFKGLPEPRPLTNISEAKPGRGKSEETPARSQTTGATDRAASAPDAQVFIEPAAAYAAMSAPLPSMQKRLWVSAAVALVLLIGGLLAVLVMNDKSNQRTATFVSTDGAAGSPSFIRPGDGAHFEIPSSAAKPEFLSLDEIKLGADQGKARAQFLLGLAYANGDGVPQDLEQAALWYQKAGAQGDANAQNNLGVFYVQGKGMELNPVAAYACFSLAARGGVKGATGNRDQLAQMLTAQQLVEAVRLANRTAAAIGSNP